MQQYPHLFTPMTLRGHKLRNRILTCPIGASFFGPASHMTDYAIEFFEQKAIGGCAVVTQGDTPVTTGEPGANMSMAKYNLREKEGFAFLCEFAETMRQHGAIASVQLNHNGSGQGSPFGVMEERGPFGSSPAATIEQIKHTEQLYFDCAKTLKDAGFDMLQIHCGHYWFPHQFLHPNNKREDEYGGCFENRLRFPLEVIKGVRKAVGPDMLIEIRVTGLYPDKSPQEFEELVEFLHRIEDDIDIVNVSSGGLMLDFDTYGTSFPMYLEPAGLNVEKTAALKARIKTPVACLGNITDPAMAEDILASGKADFIELGRAAIADPAWANKARQGKADQIRPCLQCYHCLDEMHQRDIMTCDVNPTLGHEHRLKNLSPAEKAKKLVIVGGGPAGMQAAITACDRGHKVILLEQSDALGGLLNMFDHVPCKNRVTAFKNWLVGQVRQRDIDVRLGTLATPELLTALTPDAIFAATGSKTKLPDIPGVHGANVMTATEAHFNPERVGKRVAVLGGNMSGCDTAVALLQDDHEVTIITGNLHADMSHMTSGGMDRALKGARILRNSRVTEIRENGVLVKPKPGVPNGAGGPGGAPGGMPMGGPDGKPDGMPMGNPPSGGMPGPGDPGAPGTALAPSEQFITCDTVILAAGQEPNDTLSDAIRFIANEFAEIGDCQIPGNIRTCVRTAYFAAMDL